MRIPLSLLSVAVFAAATAQAQVQVIDSSPERTRPVSGSSGQASGQQMELYYQLQTLQQEVMSLRGLVEEQSFELKQLKQQRLDDYLDLDRRVSALTGGALGTSPNSPVSAAPSASYSRPVTALSAPVASTAPSMTAAPVQTDANESAAYTEAYDLLKQRNIDASIDAFKAHLQAYPQGEYAGNSYYWLGEIYLLKNDLPAAEQWFGDLLREFPDSRKVPDAQFKLGKVYHLQGKNDRAHELLNIVAASSSDASRLAKQYLSENF